MADGDSQAKSKPPKLDLMQALTAIFDELGKAEPPSPELIKEFGRERAERLVDQSLTSPDFDPTQLTPFLGALGLKGLVTPRVFLNLLRVVGSATAVKAGRGVRRTPGVREVSPTHLRRARSQ